MATFVVFLLSSLTRSFLQYTFILLCLQVFTENQALMFKIYGVEDTQGSEAADRHHESSQNPFHTHIRKVFHSYTYLTRNLS